MAFSFRGIISNIPYFKKADDESLDGTENLGENSKKRRHTSYNDTGDSSKSNSTEKVDTVKTKKCTKVKKLYTADLSSKTGSLSDTDLLKFDASRGVRKMEKKKSKKLKLDVDKASKSASDALELAECNQYVNHFGDNTPQKLILGAKSSEIFSERLKEFDLNRSFDVFDLMNDEKLTEQNYDVQSLSEQSDSDISNISHADEVKMCRKVAKLNDSGDSQLVHSSSSESFADVELDKNEEERLSLLLSYQTKIDKMDRLLQKLLNEFRFHIEVSKIFQTKSTVTTLPGSSVTDLQNKLGDMAYIDNLSRSETLSGVWDIVIEKEDHLTKLKLKQQLVSMKHFIDDFINAYLDVSSKNLTSKPRIKAIEYNRYSKSSEDSNNMKGKRLRVNKKKRDKRFNDFPDYNEALNNLFSLEQERDIISLTVDNVTELLSDFEESECTCKCKYHIRHSSSPSSQTDSGLITKTGDDKSNHSITSSLGNFTLDSLTLSAYSESLENIISYNSFNDSSLYSTILQKAAIERITFYVQVHSIQLKSESNELDLDSKASVIFSCHSCLVHEDNEHDLLKHIFSQKHCEKIHFLYKTSYIKKCLAAGKEIQPSTVLNPMTMYRDENKIICFGDGLYACSLCFENMIVGESILMSHCGTAEHLERKGRLDDILE